MKTPFESDRAIELAMRESMRSGDLDPDDVIFYSMLNRLTASSRSVHNPSGSLTGDWESSDNIVSVLDESARGRMARDGRKLVRDDAMAGNILMKYMMHICGRGLKVSLLKQEGADGKPTPHTATELFDDIFPDGEAEETVRNLVAQTLTNGNIFVMHLPLESMFVERMSDHETTGYPQMRAVWPDHVRKIIPKDPWSFSSPVDSYIVSPPFKKVFNTEAVPADNVTHLRVFQEFNDGVWGLGLFYRFGKELPRYVDWLEQRAFKARADNLVYLFRLRAGAKSGKKYELPDRPMMIDLNKSTEDVKSISMSSGSGSDARNGDGYEFRMRLAQAVHLPEHEISENAQYAAQIGKFGFPTKVYEHIQNSLARPIRRIFAKTLGVKAEDIVLEWPRIDTRDRAQTVSEVTLLEKDRDISKGEVRRALDYDDERNKREIQEELTESMAINPGGAQFGMPGLPGAGGTSIPGMDSLGLGGPTLGGQPIGGPSPAGASPAPQQQAARPSIPGLKMTLPSSYWPRITAAMVPGSFAEKLRSMNSMSDFGIKAVDSIRDDLPTPGSLQIASIGADYGYASEGAAVVGGIDENGDIWVVGELTFKRVPSDDWAGAFKQVSDRYPSITRVYTGSDEPELTDALNRNGIEAIAKHLGEDRTKILISGFLTNHNIFIHPEAVELLTDLFPEAAQAIGGMDSTQSRVDHKDAFRYLMIGLLELSGQMENIGSPTGGTIVEQPGE